MKQVLRSAATAGLATEAGFARGLAGLARSTTGAACTTGVASCDVSFVVLFAVFFADFLTDFLAAFFAPFLGAFFATLPAVFFDALPASFTTRVRLAAPFLEARFFAAFLPVRADGDLLTFFALRFFEAFFPAFATTNSFLTQRYQGLLSDGALPRRFREHPEHRENQRFSLQIIGFGVARGADDLFPYLRQPCKAGQVRVGVVSAQLFADPAIDAVDEGRQRHPVAGAQRLAQRMQLARIDLRQRRQQCRGPLLQLQRIAAEQRQRTRYAPLRGIGRLRQRRIIGWDVSGLRGRANDVVGRERPQRQLAATGQDRRQGPRGRMADKQEQRSLRRLFEDLEQRVGGVRIELVDGVDDADPPAVHRRGRAEERNRPPRLVDGNHGPHHAAIVQPALQHQQPAMRAGGDLTRDGIVRIERERLGALH